MIFVTVGTHEQPFDRLLKCIDKMIKDGKIKDDVIVQKGYTDYEMKHCQSSKLLPYDEMQKNIENAKIIVTHGGPSSFIAPLSMGKVPIVVPRRKEYNEHVNNHQLEFVHEVESRMKNIIVAETEEEIEYAILNYDKIIKSKKGNMHSNNEAFNNNLIKEINKMM